MNGIKKVAALLGAAGGALVLIALLLLGANSVLLTYKGAVDKCGREGPYLADSEPGTRLVDGSFSKWPIARECRYVTPSGSLESALTPDAWTRTAWVYGPGATGLLLLAAGALLIPTVRRASVPSGQRM